MKKLLLAISFVFACVVVTNAQTQKASDAKPTEKTQVGDANAPVPAAAATPASVKKEDTKDAAAKPNTDKACSKQKSCCKKGDDKAKACADKEKAEANAAEPAKKSCCKDKDKASCDKKKEESKADEQPAEQPQQPVENK